MDGEPHSDGEYHYEGIGHNVLAPHISSSSSSSSTKSSSSSADGVAATPPPTSTPLLHPVIMDGEPHQEDEYHYESVGHTILPVDDSSTSYPSSNTVLSSVPTISSSNSTSISSMFAYALNNKEEEEKEGSSGNSNGQNYRQRTLLRGRKDYF